MRSPRATRESRRKARTTTCSAAHSVVVPADGSAAWAASIANNVEQASCLLVVFKSVGDGNDLGLSWMAICSRKRLGRRFHGLRRGTGAQRRLAEPALALVHGQANAAAIGNEQ